MRPIGPSKSYTCETCGHTSPYVVAEECHACWMKRVQGEPEAETLLPDQERSTT